MIENEHRNMKFHYTFYHAHSIINSFHISFEVFLRSHAALSYISEIHTAPSFQVNMFFFCSFLSRLLFLHWRRRFEDSISLLSNLFLTLSRIHFHQYGIEYYKEKYLTWPREENRMFIVKS